MKEIIEKLLDKAGIKINGKEPWDMQILNDQFYARVIQEQSLGLGESYMEGWWDCERLDEFFRRVCDAKLDQEITASPRILFNLFLSRILNFQTIQKSKEAIHQHYDLGNDLFQAMLDPSLNYSCGYWERATNLTEAQQDKMELICRKLMLKPGLKLLDIGCGWGGMAKYAAENYGVQVVGLTISEEQMKLAQERCKGLPVEIKLIDYREMPEEKFDRVVSIGMFEHVGYKNYRQYMEIVDRHLVDDGIFLLHSIGQNVSNVAVDGWIGKYIFPNGVLPSVAQIGKAIEKIFIMEDWHNFGNDYDKTLMAWYENFHAHWPELKAKYGETFYRMWKYYLLSCAGGFRAREIQLWQIVLTKKGLRGNMRVLRDLK